MGRFNTPPYRPQPQVINMGKKKYYVLNENCNNDIYEIELTEEEYKGIYKYYDIMDSMKVADMISLPMTEEEYQERLKEYKDG